MLEKIARKNPDPEIGAFGAANQSRTDDLILTKDVLYQLSHSSGSGNQRMIL